MAKSTIQYHCQSRGSVFPKWSGKCDGCGEWNTLVEERNESRAPGQKRASRSRQIELHPLSENNPEQKHQRFKSGIDELDRVTGGGFVPGLHADWRRSGDWKINLCLPACLSAGKIGAQDSLYYRRRIC